MDFQNPRVHRYPPERNCMKPEQFRILQNGVALHHDPVCGMDIEEQNAAGSVEYGGKRYYFCNPSCLQKFKADPERYLNPQPRTVIPANSRQAEYTCPMHPEIVRNGPGSCPICGMALEPREVTAEEVN